MKRKLILLALIVLALPLMAAGEKPTWYNTERDVWIDHKLERPVTIYRESGTPRILLLSKSFRHGVVLDPSSGSVASIDREKILFDVDLGEIRLDAAPRGTRGTVTRTGDGIVMATVGRRDIVIGSHQSPSGNLEVEELLRDYPVWDAKMGAYEPDESTVAELRAVKEPTTIDVVFATWCGDSRREVPRFLKTVAAAANENLKVRLIGIDADFHEPLEMIHEEKITNVPTFIVRRERREIGRIVETTATESIEADLLAIVSGDELAHPGRW